MGWRYKAILSHTSFVRLHAFEGWVPIAPAIQTGVVYFGCIMGASTRRASWSPTPLGRSSGQRAVCVIMCTPTSDVRVKEVGRNFPLLPIVVKVGCDAKGYPGSSQALFDPIFL